MRPYRQSRTAANTDRPVKIIHSSKGPRSGLPPLGKTTAPLAIVLMSLQLPGKTASAKPAGGLDRRSDRGKAQSEPENRSGLSLYGEGQIGPQTDAQLVRLTAALRV